MPPSWGRCSNLDWAGVAVFATSGALVAAAKRQTLVTFVFFAVVTGIGGGTARDLLIGAPVFWIQENTTLRFPRSRSAAARSCAGGLFPHMDARALPAIGLKGE